MTMNEMKKAIVASFKEQYGFAPAMKDITPLESSGYSNQIIWLAFWVNGIGYTYDAYGKVERAEVYDREA